MHLWREQVMVESCRQVFQHDSGIQRPGMVTLVMITISDDRQFIVYALANTICPRFLRKVELQASNQDANLQVPSVPPCSPFVPGKLNAVGRALS